MKDNKDILNEAFFKSVSRRDKLAKSLPQYTPVDPKGVAPAYQVSDTDEVKKRLGGVFSVAFGNNSVRSMASKAIKQFPIIVSDDIEPETVIMLKRLMEDQYAEYINLLVSNQVVDLSSYTAGEETGNIAIQALDTISGSNFSKTRLADKAGTSALSADDIFANIPLYNLLREQHQALVSGDSVIDLLLENACILPSESANKLVEFMLNEDNDLSHEEPLNEVLTATAQKFKYANRTTSAQLEGPSIIIDKDKFEKAIADKVGAILKKPQNAPILDKFEKATMLLQSNFISGMEYTQYLTLRLGIPVSAKIRKELALKFQAKDIIDFSNSEGGYVVDDKTAKRIAKNKRIIEPIISDIADTRLQDALSSAGIGVLGGIAGNVVTAAVSATSIIALGPLIVGSLAAAAAGVGAFKLLSFLRKKEKRAHEESLRKAYDVRSKIEGWERVEALIEKLEEQQAEVLNGGKNAAYVPVKSMKNLTVDSDIDITGNIKSFEATQSAINSASRNDYVDSYTSVSNMFNKILKESAERITYTQLEENDEDILLRDSSAPDIFKEVLEEGLKDEKFREEFLNERKLASISTLSKKSSPVEIRYVESKPGKDIMVAPAFMARSTMAYGSTEIERKENKDRKYNQPLIMTIKFKERFSDGKFSDNELTAVIGILGKVIRIPSEEMEYILKENTEGNTIEGFFKSSNGNLNNIISDILSTSKISKELQSMPQSAEIWHNLEKITTLAAANKISGKRNNNIANAHIVFSQREIDAVRNETGIDYLRDIKKTVALMKRYSAFTLMIANDPGQRAYIFDDQDGISWNIIPYSALTGKDSGDQLNAALAKLGRLV